MSIYRSLTVAMAGILAFTSSVKAQQPSAADSLRGVLGSSIHDTVRIHALTELGWTYMYENPDSAISIGNRALQLAEATDWPRGVPMAKARLGAFHFAEGDNQRALEYYKYALDAFRKLKDKDNEAKILGNIGTVRKVLGEHEQALKDYTKALEIYNASGNKAGMASIEGSLGMLNKEFGDYSEALDHLRRSAALYEEVEDWKGVNRQLGNIGVIYRAQGNLTKALEYYFRALKMAEEQGMKENISARLSNIGIIYKEQGDRKRALEYLHRALAIDQETGMRRDMALKLGNIGIVHSELNEFDKALDFYNRALKIDTELGVKDGIARHTGNIGNVYKKQADRATDPTERRALLLKALDHYERAYQMSVELQNRAYIAADLITIASVHIALKNWSLAEKPLLEALTIAREGKYILYEREAHGKLADLFEAKGEFKQAYGHYHRYVVLRDSLMNDDKSREITRLELQFNYDMKAMADSLRFESIKAVKDLELRQRESSIRTLQLGIAVFLALIAALVFVLRRLTFSNRTVLRQKSELESLLAEKDVLMKEIHHRVKNNLQIVSSLLSLQSSFSKDGPEAEGELKKALMRINSMSILHKELYSGEDITKVNLQEYIQELFQQIRVFFDKDLKLDVSMDISDSIMLETEKAIPIGLILNELVTNTIKHNVLKKGEGRIRLLIKEIDDKLEFHYSDRSDESDGQEAGGQATPMTKGFGSHLIEIFAKKLKATMETRLGNGLEFTMRFSQ
jgi:two-component system, sensor histidine kinase PdtaS